MVTQEVTATITIGTEARAKSRPILSALHRFKGDLPKGKDQLALGALLP